MQVSKRFFSIEDNQSKKKNFLTLEILHQG